MKIKISLQNGIKVNVNNNNNKKKHEKKKK